MKNLVIICAGGFGREVCSIARESLGFGTEFVIKGFVDDNLDALSGFEGYPPVIASVSDYRPEENDVFITACGSTKTRRRLVEMIKSRGGKFISLVHRSASVAPGVTMGEGTLVAQFAVVSVDVRIGSHVCVFQNSVVGHDSILEDFSHVYSLCAVGGGVRICSGAVVYPGSGIVPRREIGAEAVVGIGSVVLLNVNPGETVFGNPAKPVQ